MKLHFDRERIAGYVLLFALLILAIGGWQWLVDGDGEGPGTMAVGGVILFGGLVMLGWDAGKTAPAETPVDEEPAVSPAVSPPPPAAAPEKASQRFTVVQTGDDAALDIAGDILGAEPRITAITYESGRWYSVPDGDDLPEWHALRVTCDVPDLDAFMQEVDAMLKARMDPRDFSEISISHY